MAYRMSWLIIGVRFEFHPSSASSNPSNASTITGVSPALSSSEPRHNDDSSAKRTGYSIAPSRPSRTTIRDIDTSFEVILARLPRYAAPGFPQHVTQRGNNRSVMFVAPADYLFLRECLVAACAKHGCRVHAYAFMTNHFHLLVTPTTADGVSEMMQTAGRRYVRRFNDTYQRTGTLWEGRYKATVVEVDRYLMACHRYIELNPVRAGLVKGPANYPWSSYRANALGTRDPLVGLHESLHQLGADARARRSAYRALLGDGLPDTTLNEIRNATDSGWALGNQRFREEIAELLGRRTQPAIRGRPPRSKDEIRI
jgi:putative transposase